jgi:hypothetical protein
LWIEETPQTQVAIGSITTDEEHREQLAPEIQLTTSRDVSGTAGERSRSAHPRFFSQKAESDLTKSTTVQT